jgi:hypothetical protein
MMRCLLRSSPLADAGNASGDRESSSEPWSETGSETWQALLPSTTILVGVAAAPLLVGLIGGRLVAQLFHDCGELSEELFRGDRLPILALSHPDQDDPPSP